MQYFPIFVDSQSLNVLVVGGGEVATRKVELLLKTHANITVISPCITREISALVAEKKVTHLPHTYAEHWLDDIQLVFIATADAALNSAITAQAKQRNIFANVVDSPQLCSFITPSIIDRTPMVFAISSEGTAPVLVRYWRERLEGLIPKSLGDIARFSGEKRQEIKRKFSDGGQRRRFWERFFSASESDTPSLLSALFTRLLAAPNEHYSVIGELYIIQVSANEELLSLTALRHMQQSDRAIIDDGVKPAVQELVRRDANIESLDLTAPHKQLQAHLAAGERVCLLTTQSLTTWQNTLSTLLAHYPVRQFKSAPAVD